MPVGENLPEGVDRIARLSIQMEAARNIAMKTISFLVLISLLWICPADLYAQAPNQQPPLLGGPKRDKKEDANVRSVQGVVRGPSDSLVEGAVVHLKDTKSLRVRSFITREDGGYRFHGLSTDVDYELRANFQDLSSEVRRLSVFDSRRNAVINLKLESKQ